MAALSINEQDLVENPTPRVPVCLCIDTSASMCGDKARELVIGINLFYDAIKDDDDARDAAEICIVEYSTGASLIHEFSSIERLARINQINANGQTHMGEGVNLALDTLEDRKRQYSDNGVLYYQPWLILMTDGSPYGGSQKELDRAIKRVVNMTENKKLTVFPIGIGDKANMSSLASFSPNRSPLQLKGLNFKEFFEWLSKSVSRVSQSTPGDSVKLDLSGLAGWAEL
jgi:uncharacterized protein YegL